MENKIENKIDVREKDAREIDTRKKQHYSVLLDNPNIATTTVKTERLEEDMDCLLLSGYKGMHNQGFKGQGVKVAVLDTGINKNHELFKDINVTQLSKTYGIGVDDNFHGSFCCGTIVDFLPEIDELISIKVLDILGGGMTTKTITKDIIEGIYEAVSRDADIISMSLGIRSNELARYVGLKEEFHEAIKYAVNNDVAVVVACGNDADSTWDLYPAFFPEVISVGAVDEWYNPAWFTSVSEEVDVCQIGVDVWSAHSKSNNGYIKSSGTSMATPITAGMLGLIICKFKSLGLSGTIEPFAYKTLKMGCVDLNEPQWDDTTGVGFATFKDDIRVVKYPYDEDAMYVNGEKVDIPMGLKNVKIDEDNEWSEVKAMLPVREDNSSRGNPVDWKPKDINGDIFNGVIVRG